MGKKIKENIYLLGPRASGKSTVGKVLAKKLGFKFVDLDKVIVERENASIKSIVNKYGWNYFRELEKQCLLATESLFYSVIATGGGVVLLEDNRCFLQEKNYTFYLKVDIDTLIERLRFSLNRENRPALTNLSLEQEVKQIVLERDDLYQKCSRYVVNGNVSPEIVCEQILKFL